MAREFWYTAWFLATKGELAALKDFIAATLQLIKQPEAALSLGKAEDKPTK